MIQSTLSSLHSTMSIGFSRNGENFLNYSELLKPFAQFHETSWNVYVNVMIVSADWFLESNFGCVFCESV